MAAVVMDALVEVPDRLLQAEPPQERLRPAQERPGRAREEEEPEDERAEDEDALEPQVGGHVVLADREQEADRAERDRRRAAEPALEQDGAGDDGRSARVAPRRLHDADRVASERGRKHLPGRVRDEVGTGQPRHALVDRVRGEQPAPAQREHRNGADHDHDRQREPGEIRVGEDVERRAEVDLPDEVRDRGGRQDERPDLPRPTRHASVRPRASRGDGTKVVGWGRVRTPDPSRRLV